MLSEKKNITIVFETHFSWKFNTHTVTGFHNFLLVLDIFMSDEFYEI